MRGYTDWEWWDTDLARSPTGIALCVCHVSMTAGKSPSGGVQRLAS
jgi:hypothetical protein